MKKIKSIGLLALFAAALVLLPACKEGGAENVGEKIDNAAEKTADKVKDATN